MSAGNQNIIELKNKFALLDDNHDGFINLDQLKTFMKDEKMFKIDTWKINEVLVIIIKDHDNSLK